MVKYTYNENKDENISKAIRKNAKISFKKTVETLKAIKGKNALRAVSFLEDVLNKKAAVEYRVFNKKMPHRKGKMGAGGYPIKVCEEVLTLLKSSN